MQANVSSRRKYAMNGNRKPQRRRSRLRRRQLRARPNPHHAARTDMLWLAFAVTAIFVVSMVMS